MTTSDHSGGGTSSSHPVLKISAVLQFRFSLGMLGLRDDVMRARMDRFLSPKLYASFLEANMHGAGALPVEELSLALPPPPDISHTHHVLASFHLLRFGALVDRRREH